ncbi:MAG TPA: exodeoxyribonuclease III [Planctomycetota bacterium]|nr:exodeoxyribonuclease III [Planctomycetota bacterium]
MKIATWNVNSIRARMERVVEWLDAKRPDVLCMQEIKCLDEQFPRQTFEDMGYRVATFGQKTYNGVAILAKQNIEDVVRGLPNESTDAQKRVIGAQVGDVLLLNLYVVNGQEVGSAKYAYKMEWMARVAEFVRERYDMGEKVVLCGDFNVTFDDRDVQFADAWREKILCSTDERRALAKIVEVGLHDAFRHFHEESGHYTWWDFRTRGFLRGDGLRIDHFLMSEPALRACAGVEIDKAARGGEKPSDHAPVIAEMG